MDERQVPPRQKTLSYSAPTGLVAEPRFPFQPRLPMQRKVIFDAVRRMLGRGFARAEVRALDDAIDTAANGHETATRDAFGGGNSSALARPAHKVSARGLALIKAFEGCGRMRADGLVEAYPDPGTGGDPWTIGWGATGRGIGPGTVWSQAQCDARLEADIERHAVQVAAALGGAPTTQAQFDALVSFHYNTGSIRRATLTRLHREGDFAGAAREFARWNRAGGRVMRGLTRRRAAEASFTLREHQPTPELIVVFGSWNRLGKTAVQDA
jgi:lysozyme